jgi:two-component system, OmpR family, sensor histidine kinase KdpD
MGASEGFLVYKIFISPPAPLLFLYKRRLTFAPSKLPHVVPDSKKSPEFFIACLSVVLTAAACFPATELIGYRSVALLMLLTVSVLAMRLSLWPVLTAATLSALVWNYLFIPPIFTFHVSSGEDVLLLVMFFIVGLLNGIFNYRLRTLEQVKRQKEERENTIRLYNALFSSLSHELRTPIAAIVGASDALQENTAPLSPDQRSELVSEISEASLRLHQQVENLLNTSRVEAGFVQPKADWCDVSDLIYNVLEKLKHPLADYAVAISIPEDFPLLYLDYGLTEQVLFNLLNNATQHTPSGSRIEISAKIMADRSGHFTGTEARVDLASVTDTVSHTLLLEVCDNGPGFPPDEMPFVFDKFYRLQNARTGGTGLGLFIAKGFVEAQGGEISVSNRPDGGAKFSIELPTRTVDEVDKVY